MEKRSFVMMIDDDRSVLNLIKRIMEMDGDAGASESAREMLSQLTAASPNLVIMDIETSDLEEPELLESLKDGIGTPALLLTTRCQVTTLRDALTACSYRAASKPSPPREMVAQLLSRLKNATPGPVGTN